MSWTLVYTESYNKRAARFLKKHPERIDQYEKTLNLLELNLYHPSLRLHQLTGKLSSLHSVSINLSYRITMEMVLMEKEILLVNVGSHNEVY